MAAGTVKAGLRVLPGAWLLAFPVACTVAMYFRFFAGYWLGDDFGNLYHAWLADQSGELLQQAWTQFFSGASSQGAFYRPVMFASIFVNEWIAGATYAGWFAVNLAIHLANVLLVGATAAHLARMCDRDGRVAGAVAALFFALCPLPAEGVFWISARADAFVTLLTLSALYVWSVSRSPASRAMCLPLLLVAALGFKESGAVFPLQMLLVALAWPARVTRAQWTAIAAGFVLVAIFLVLRGRLFGDAWRVYYAGAGTPSLARLREAIASLPSWWSALTHSTRQAANLYAALAALASLALLAGAGSRSSTRLTAALLAACAGLVVATFLNLGSMGDTGEGGRLAYTPIAWLALALGVAGAAPRGLVQARGWRDAARLLGMGLLLLACVSGSWVLEGELAGASGAERGMRALAQSLPAWARSHPGLTLLVIPEHDGPVITGRNAQAGLVMPPLQREPLLHRVLPTVPREVEARHGQLEAGLASRLETLRPARVDAQTLARIFAPDTARWPDRYACWSTSARRIMDLSSPDPRDRARWVDQLEQAAEQCPPHG
ncbi:MAG TPA: hypothetical protein VLN42_09380 [Casimicrobiaceae bacterium]|nr:hypothetical protein [Casimicrobiaceae bacterium]